MSFILEMLPLFTLGAGYFIGKAVNPAEAIYFLSYGAIIGTVIQFLVYKIRKEKMQTMTLVTGIVLIVFSTLTVVLRNPMFVYMKPTVVPWLFALGFFIYPRLKGQTVLEMMMGTQFDLEKAKWNILNWAWIIFNFIIGAVNLFIALQVYTEKMSPDIWVSFKIWVLPAATLIFVAGQTLFMLKNGKVLEEKDSSGKKM